MTMNVSRERLTAEAVEYALEVIVYLGFAALAMLAFVITGGVYSAAMHRGELGNTITIVGGMVLLMGGLNVFIAVLRRLNDLWGYWEAKAKWKTILAKSRRIRHQVAEETEHVWATDESPLERHEVAEKTEHERASEESPLGGIDFDVLYYSHIAKMSFREYLSFLEMFSTHRSSSFRKSLLDQLFSHRPWPEVKVGRHGWEEDRLTQKKD